MEIETNFKWPELDTFAVTKGECFPFHQAFVFTELDSLESRQYCPCLLEKRDIVSPFLNGNV